MPTRFASSVDGAPILAARAYADEKGVNIDQYYAKKTELFSGDYNDLTNKPDLSVYALASSLATVATSGSYNDLTDKPSIPDPQVQSDWNQTNSSAVDFIKNRPTLFSGDYNDLTNKPDLSVYALSSSLATVATSGSYNDLTDKPSIPAAQVNSDWNAVSGVAQILNKPDLSVYALASSLATVATSGDYNDLQNKPTIPAAQVQSDYAQADSNAVDYIKNKPDLSVYALSSSLATVATSGSYNDLTDKPSIPAAQVQSDYGQTDSSAVDYIKNKPDLSVYALSSSLASVATSGDYDDLINKPSIPAAQIQSDYAQTDSSAVDFIKNKPDLSVYALSSSLATVATSGSYNDLTDKPSIPSAQVQSDYAQSDSSAVDYIKNKPDLSVYALASSLATVATSGSYNDLSNKPSIPAAQVQSDWAQSNSASVDYIKNKPTQIGLVAGSNITLTEDAQNGTLTIASQSDPQVQADWSQSDSSAVDYIKNKPDLSVYALSSSLATVATSGSYADLSNTPTFSQGTNVQISQSGNTYTFSATDTTYAAGAGIDITNNIISVDADDLNIDYWHGGSSTALASGTNLNANLSSVSSRGQNIYANSGAVTLKTGTYAVHAFVKVNNSGITVDPNLYKLTITGGITGGSPIKNVEFDNSFTHEEVYELSFLTLNTSENDAALVLTTDALSQLAGLSVTLSYIQVYCLNGLVGVAGGGGSGTETVSVVSTNNTVGVSETTVGGVKTFDLSVPTQVNADWSSSSGKSQILNKPDLSVYALSANLATVATSGSYNDLSNKPTIVTPVQSDWSQANSSSLDYIKNKPDLSVYALSSSLATVATSGSYTDLSNKPSIPSVDQVYDGTSANAQSGVAMAGALANKQDNMVVLEYGTSTWADFMTAFNKNAVVYCRVNSSRMAFMAYYNSSEASVEFQYIRSIATHNASNQGDQVFIYKLFDDSHWVTITREMVLSAQAGNGVERTITTSSGAGTIEWSVKAAANGGITVDSNGVSVTNKVPDSTSSDEDKILSVNSNGEPEWKALPGIINPIYMPTFTKLYAVDKSSATNLASNLPYDPRTFDELRIGFLIGGDVVRWYSLSTKGVTSDPQTLVVKVVDGASNLWERWIRINVGSSSVEVTATKRYQIGTITNSTTTPSNVATSSSASDLMFITEIIGVNYTGMAYHLIPNETELWSSASGHTYNTLGNIVLNEAFTNFERIRIVNYFGIAMEYDTAALNDHIAYCVPWNGTSETGDTIDVSACLTFNSGKTELTYVWNALVRTSSTGAVSRQTNQSSNATKIVKIVGINRVQASS